MAGTYTGAYQGGVVTHSRSTVKKNNVAQPTTDTANTYVWFDTAKQNVTSYKPDVNGSTVNTTTYYYDSFGFLYSANIQDGRPRSVTFLNNTEGLVMVRSESDNNSSTGDPHEVHYYFNGLAIGDVSNNGTSDVDYAAGIAAHQTECRDRRIIFQAQHRWPYLCPRSAVWNPLISSTTSSADFSQFRPNETNFRAPLFSCTPGDRKRLPGENTRKSSTSSHAMRCSLRQVRKTRSRSSAVRVAGLASDMALAAAAMAQAIPTGPKKLMPRYVQSCGRKAETKVMNAISKVSAPNRAATMASFTRL